MVTDRYQATKLVLGAAGCGLPSSGRWPRGLAEPLGEGRLVSRFQHSNYFGDLISREYSADVCSVR